jgi:predicted DNA-binding protein with PD1-like motif
MDVARSVKQPGPPAARRVQSVEGRCSSLEVSLEPGLTLLEAVRRPLAAFGCSSAAVELEGGALGPFSYFLPAYSETPEHAAFYSQPFSGDGVSALKAARGTFGMRDGSPLLHCHAIWSQHGTARGGHLLTTEAIVAAPIKARIWSLDGVGFEAHPDAETNFTLFGPVVLPQTLPSSDQPRSKRCFALRLLPNQDICTALEDFCRSEGVSAAVVRGGVASIIGAIFEDGSSVTSEVTEMLICTGTIASGSHGATHATLDVELVDHKGEVAAGRLVRGANPILITAEIVLEVLARLA